MNVEIRSLFVKVYSKLVKIAREGLFVNLFEAREDFLKSIYKIIEHWRTDIVFTKS